MIPYFGKKTTNINRLVTNNSLKITSLLAGVLKSLIDNQCIAFKAFKVIRQTSKPLFDQITEANLLSSSKERNLSMTSIFYVHHPSVKIQLINFITIFLFPYVLQKCYDNETNTPQSVLRSRCCQNHPWLSKNNYPTEVNNVSSHNLHTSSMKLFSQTDSHYPQIILDICNNAIWLLRLLRISTNNKIQNIVIYDAVRIMLPDFQALSTLLWVLEPHFSLNFKGCSEQVV